MPDEITTAATLEEVLAGHMSCGERYCETNGPTWRLNSCGDCYADIRQAAAAVRAWLAERLADGGLREAVARSISPDPQHLEDRQIAHDAATAALAAVTAALGVGEGAA